jgi:hypothetical protein
LGLSEKSSILSPLNKMSYFTLILKGQQNVLELRRESLKEEERWEEWKEEGREGEECRGNSKQ